MVGAAEGQGKKTAAKAKKQKKSAATEEKQKVHINARLHNII